MITKIEKRVMLTKNFSEKEMKCKCKRKECDALPMNEKFMEKLQELRDQWGKPLHPTSASRCKYWNSKILGSKNSQHLLANACDFFFEKEDELEDFILLAEKIGFKGIGHGHGKIHIDNREVKARWTY